MPVVGQEIEVSYIVVSGWGKQSNGRILEVANGDKVLGEIEVLPQEVRWQGLDGLDGGAFALFVLLDQAGKIKSHRFEKRQQM